MCDSRFLSFLFIPERVSVPVTAMVSQTRGLGIKCASSGTGALSSSTPF